VAAAFFAGLILATLTGCTVESDDTDEGDDYITLALSK
jgi:hypothetical protein